MSEIYNPGVIGSIRAAADLVVKRFIGTDGNLCGAGAHHEGVSINATNSGQMCAIVVSGIATVEAGAAVTVGSAVKSDATGRAINTSLATDANGVALEAATAAGQFIRVKLK